MNQAKIEKILALAESERKLGNTRAADNMESLAARMAAKAETQEFAVGDDVYAPRWYQIWPEKGSYELCKARIVSISYGQKYGIWTKWCTVDWQDHNWPQNGPNLITRWTVKLSEVESV